MKTLCRLLSPARFRSGLGVFFVMATILNLHAQATMTLDQALQTAFQNNGSVQAAASEINYFKEVKKTSGDIGKLNAVWMHGQYNSVYQDNNYTLTQSIPFPTLLSRQSALGREQVIGAEKNLIVVKNELAFEVKSAWFQLLYFRALQQALLSQDSLYAGFARASTARYASGESNLLEKTTAETQLQESGNQLRQNASDVLIVQTRLQTLLKAETPPSPAEPFGKKEVDADTTFLFANPRLLDIQQQVVVGTMARKVEQHRILPDITFGYFNQSLIGVQNVNGQDQFYGRTKHFQGFELGLAVPLWIGPHLARARSLAAREETLHKQADYFKTTLTGDFHQAIQELEKNKSSLRYYETNAMPNAKLILQQSRSAWTRGEIGYVEYLQSLKLAAGIREKYLQMLNLYNQSIVKIEFLTGTF